MRKRPLANLNNILVERLVRTGLHNTCFTERQKLSLLHVTGPVTVSTQNLFHNSMLELNLVAVGMTSEPPPVLSPMASPSPKFPIPTSPSHHNNSLPGRFIPPKS